MNNVLLGLIITLGIILLFFIPCLCYGEYLRKNHSLQEFKNVDTKRASFSLTTIPSRINHIEPNLISLLSQNPKTVYLNIPYYFKKTGKSYDIPKWLDKYTETGEVTVVRTDDKGPATKFLGIIDQTIHPEHYIIVVDDDQIYNDKMLSNLVYKADNLGGESVVCCNLDSGSVTGYSGFIFKRKLLNNISRFIWPKECFLVDDPWITNYFKYNKIPINQLFDISVSNISIEKTSDNIISFLKSILVSNYNLQKGSYRTKVQQIDPLYVNRGNKNLECEIALNKLLS